MFRKLFKEKIEERFDNQPFRLLQNEHIQTRELWELIFTEDSKDFVDYYYSEKISENQIYVIKNGHLLVSMLQLNPYQIHLGRAILPAHYIVGVATREEFRRKGLMRKMIVKALSDLYQNKECITYLMPAKVEYYDPFDFSVVYQQKSGLLEIESNDELEFVCEPVEETDYKELARLLENRLVKEYSIFTAREEDSFLTLQHQFQSEHGDFIIVKKLERMIGCFLFGEYDDIEVIEPICEVDYEKEFLEAIKNYFIDKNKKIKVTAFSEKMSSWMTDIKEKPAIMIRIVNIEMLSRYLRAKEDIEIVVDIKDPLVPQNNGTFLFQAGPDYSLITQTEKEPEISCTIKEITQFLFTNKEIEDGLISDKLHLISRFESVYINELV